MLTPVDIVLPCYNPSDKWYLELIHFHQHIRQFYRVNFILVNDGSSENKIAEQIEMLQQEGISINYISYPKNAGKGHALRQGVLSSTNEFVIYTDIDFPFTDESTSGLIKCLVDTNCDIIAGYRNQNYYQKSMTSFRKLLSKTFRYFIKKILKMPVTDTQCGLKGFNSKGKAKFLSTKINRYLFDFEFIYLSCRDSSITIKTIEVQLKDNVVFSKMKLKILFQELFNLMYVLMFRKN